MIKIYSWYNNLSKRIRDSIVFSLMIIGAVSTVLTILGISLKDLKNSNLWFRFCIIVVAFLLIFVTTYIVLGKIFNSAVKITIRQTPVSVGIGDIFDAPELRVIGCDTHFDTRVNNIVISEKSLHGKLVVEHGNKKEIIAAVEAEAKRLGLSKNSEGLYEFPLGTIVQYDSSVDNHTYLMLAMTELNGDHESHTDMSKYEHMLMRMWKEIDRVYASRDIAMPLLGSGISRFDNGTKEKESLLRCMLCTLKNSGVCLNSKVSILIYSEPGDIPLYEYKDIFHTVARR